MQKGPPAKEAPFGIKVVFGGIVWYTWVNKLSFTEVAHMGLIKGLFKSSFEKWIEGASSEELSVAYEEERKEWIKMGAEIKHLR